MYGWVLAPKVRSVHSESELSAIVSEHRGAVVACLPPSADGVKDAADQFAAAAHMPAVQPITAVGDLSADSCCRKSQEAAALEGTSSDSVVALNNSGL